MAGHSSSVIGNTMVVFGGSLGARQMYDHVMCLYYPLPYFVGNTKSLKLCC